METEKNDDVNTNSEDKEDTEYNDAPEKDKKFTGTSREMQIKNNKIGGTTNFFGIYELERPEEPQIQSISPFYCETIT